MPHMTSLSPNLPSRRMRWLALLARLLLWLTVAFWVLFGAGWGFLHGWIVPRIGEFRPRLEIAASKAFGVAVHIGQITARSEGLMPSFELRDVVLLDAQGREALRLPRLLAAVSPASLWGLGFEQLSIDQPVLEMRRSASGEIYIGGLLLSQGRDNTTAVADWVFSQAEISIKGGTVRWTDELRLAPTLVLSQVDGVLRNGGRRHAMRLDATPAPQWGERFSLRGLFKQPLLAAGAGQWANWSGQLYAQFSRVDVSRLKAYASLDTLGVDLRQGNGSLRAWADVTRGQITGGTADMALNEVDAQLGHALEPLALESLAGRVSGSLLADGFEIRTEGLRFNTKDGLLWPGGNLALVHTGADGKTAQQNQLKADRLDLAAVAQIANRLPLGTATHALITSYAPKGLVETLDAHWQVPLGGPPTYAAKGRVTGLELASLAGAMVPATLARPVPHELPGRPGVRGASVDFDVTQAGGKAVLGVVNGSLDLPGVFEEPRIALAQLSLDAQWKLVGDQLDTQLRNIKFSNADAEGVAQASWHSAKKTVEKSTAAAGAHDESLGVLDLQGSLSRGDGARVHRYLPLVLPDQVRHYVRDAVVQGDISDVKFRVKGPVDEIPFANPAAGEFKVTAKVKNGIFAYVPKSTQPKDAQAWPILTAVRGELVFDHAALDVIDASAGLASPSALQLVRADARIPNLVQAATLDLRASLKGPLADALGFVNASPLGGMTDAALAKAVATGEADYAVQLNLPLHNIDKTRVQGTVSLPGNDVQFTPDSPQLTRLKGAVTFSETGFNVASAQARLLGGDIRFEGGTRNRSRTAAVGGSAEPSDASVLFKAQGNVTAEGLQQARYLGLVSGVAHNASGGAAYLASLGFRGGAAELMVSSNLQGMTLNLPAPLNKSADTVLPLRYENTLLRDSLLPGQKLQDQLALTLGNIASIVYVRDISGAQARVVRGGISVGLEPGASVPLPDNGVTANINLAKVDLDAWDKALSVPADSSLNIPPASPTGARPESRSVTSAAALDYLPTQIAIRAKELHIAGRTLNRVVLGGTRDGLNWRGNIDAAELNGYVEFRQPGGAGAGAAGRVYARLSRLSLGPNNASDVESLLDEQPANIPALDIVVDDLELRGKKLGRIEIDAVNRGASLMARDGSAREWRLNKFNITLPEATLAATGDWIDVSVSAPVGVQAALPRMPRGPGERRRTALNFKLDILDSGELLRRFGMNGVVRRGKGKMEGQVTWLGSPLSLDYPSMNGQFNVNIEAGQFLKAEPGIAKLLGVLSLQALPRRLTLDFRDVFAEGFAFDFVRGDVTIRQGVAATNNLQMKGVNAAVLMEGSADIARETQDLKVVVVPEINAGTASLIATVINPAIGLGSFLAQYFLRRPLIQAATQELHIDGSWTDPKVTKVERRP